MAWKDPARRSLTNWLASVPSAYTDLFVVDYGAIGCLTPPGHTVCLYVVCDDSVSEAPLLPSLLATHLHQEDRALLCPSRAEALPRNWTRVVFAATLALVYEVAGSRLHVRATGRPFDETGRLVPVGFDAPTLGLALMGQGNTLELSLQRVSLDELGNLSEELDVPKARRDAVYCRGRAVYSVLPGMLDELRQSPTVTPTPLQSCPPAVAAVFLPGLLLPFLERLGGVAVAGGPTCYRYIRELCGAPDAAADYGIVIPRTAENADFFVGTRSSNVWRHLSFLLARREEVANTFWDQEDLDVWWTSEASGGGAPQTSTRQVGSASVDVEDETGVSLIGLTKTFDPTTLETFDDRTRRIGTALNSYLRALYADGSATMKNVKKTQLGQRPQHQHAVDLWEALLTHQFEPCAYFFGALLDA